MEQLLTTNYTTLIYAALGILVISTLCLLKKFTILKRALKEECSKKMDIIQTVNHDFKIAVLAQQRALEIMQKVDAQGKEELLQEISNSNVFLLDMINMLLFIQSPKQNNVDFKSFDFGKEVNCSIEKKSESFSKRNLNTKIQISDSINILQGDKEKIEKIIALLLETTSQNAKSDSDYAISVTPKQNKTEFSISYVPKVGAEKEAENFKDEKLEYCAVGQKIKNQYINKVLALHNSKMTACATDKHTCKVSFALDNQTKN